MKNLCVFPTDLHNTLYKTCMQVRFEQPGTEGEREQLEFISATVRLVTSSQAMEWQWTLSASLFGKPCLPCMKITHDAFFLMQNLPVS